MTLPCERYNAIKYTERFLMDLCDPKKTPRVPLEVRNRARSCLRHYPGPFDLDMLSTKCPEIIDSGTKVDELSVLMHNYETKKNDYR
jgi:hypothetical protein